MSEGAQNSRLPRVIEPFKLARQGLEMRGYILLTDLPRVMEVSRSAGEVVCELSFSVDEHFRSIVEGNLIVALQLECQRCLQNANWPINASVKLAIMTNDEKSLNLPKHIDPWLVPGSEASLYELVEEELLLNIPLVCRHEYDCGGLVETDGGANTGNQGVCVENGNPVSVRGQENVSEAVNPFQVLESLKTTLQKSDD